MNRNYIFPKGINNQGKGVSSYSLDAIKCIMHQALSYIMLSMLLALLLAQPASGQGTKPRRQTIVMNDGTWMVGKVLTDTAGFMRIDLVSPHIVTIRKSQVASMQAYNPREVETDVARTGYFIKLTGSMLLGKNEIGNVGSPSFHLSNGYKFVNGFSAGVGTGIEELEITVLPVYAEFGYYMMQKHVTPFLWLKGGYGFPLPDVSEGYYPFSYGSDYEGGFMLSSGAGVALYSWRRNAVSIGFGYRFQQITITEQNDWWMSSLPRQNIFRFNRIELQLGFIFR